MRWYQSLFTRIAVILLLLLVLMGSVLIYISLQLSSHYSNEAMQKLNASVAMYVAGQEPLINEQGVDNRVLDQLAQRAMIINPSLEIYIVDLNGQILAHRLPQADINKQSIDLSPINAFLSGETPFPILGTDPRRPNQKTIFSTSPITLNDKAVGYVYAIVGGQHYQTLKQQASDSYSLRIALILSVATLLLAVVMGAMIMFFFSRRLSHLSQALRDFDPNAPQQLIKLPSCHPEEDDEVTHLERSFAAMSTKISEQLEAITVMDQTRRELVANVSHDLRTPLASLQGYLEVLMIKRDRLSENEKHQHLETAYKQCKRLERLISELFELAKLESGATNAQHEQFSLLELANDCCQDYQILAQQKNVKLLLNADSQDFAVVTADIGLIQRVLQNLIDNAIRYTPDNGEVVLHLVRENDQVKVRVSDSGKGIHQSEIPHLFDRLYQSKSNQASENIGSGLGLAIVKRILELHNAVINVKSELGRGSEFSFALNTQAMVS